jgi:hypothetical protein
MVHPVFIKQKLAELAKPGNIADLLSLSRGQCKLPEEEFECLIA